nr:16S rRNA (guanine(527)-N(7))-methyltransferase RsmG [Marinibactrum halimedae]
MQIELSTAQVDLLIQYVTLFHKWNKTYNLSAIRNIEEVVDRHILDSLSVFAYLPQGAQRFIDVGTGGGLPGIPLAIVRPDMQVTMLDSNGKKTRFLFQVLLELGLKNAAVVNERVERYQPDMLFDGVISRAFASLWDMVSGCEHLLHCEGFFWAMKGVYPQSEIEELPERFQLEQSYEIQVARCDGQRHLLKLSKQSA